MEPNITENKTNSKLLIPALAVLTIVFLLAIYIFTWTPQEIQKQTRTSRPTTVRSEIITPTVFVDSIEALGTTTAREAVNVTAKKSGIVDSIHFKDGDQVAKNAILITLKKEQEEAKVEEMKTRLSEEKRQLERLFNLKKSQATARSAYEEQQSRVKEFEAKLNVAEAQLNELIIRAPFDGVLGLRSVAPGSLVAPGTLITTLDDLQVVKVDFSIPETFLSALSKGQIIEALSSAWPDDAFQGIVTNISSRIDPVTRAVNIRAEISNTEEKLRPGMLLTITLIKNRNNALMIPETALLPIESKNFIFKIQDKSTARKVEVITGRRKAGRVEILKGLSDGDEVVYEGVLKLQDGSQVTILADVTGNDA